MHFGLLPFLLTLRLVPHRCDWFFLFTFVLTIDQRLIDFTESRYDELVIFVLLLYVDVFGPW